MGKNRVTYGNQGRFLYGILASQLCAICDCLMDRELHRGKDDIPRGGCDCPVSSSFVWAVTGALVSALQIQKSIANALSLLIYTAVPLGENFLFNRRK